MNSRGPAQQHLKFTPLAAITPYRNNVCFKVRLTEKSTTRTWNNDKGAGRLFTCIFMDSNSDTISARFFTEAHDKYYDSLHVGNVYSIQDAKITLPRQKGSTTSEYELTIDAANPIAQMDDDETIPRYSMKQVRGLDSIATHNDPNAVYDFLAIIHSSRGGAPFTTKKGTESYRRDFSIVDKSGLIVEVTFWGDIGKNYTDEQFKEGSVILLQGVRTNEFNGAKSIQSGFNTSCTFGMTDPRSKALLAWYNATDKNDFKSLKQLTQNENPNADPNRVKRIFTRDRLNDIDEEAFIQAFNISPEHIEWVNFDGQLNRVMYSPVGRDGAPSRAPVYPACPSVVNNRPCSKRMTEMGADWTCDGCGSTYPQPTYRFIASALIQDDSGSKTVSFFDREFEALIGKTANEIQQMHTDDPQGLAEWFGSLSFKPINLLLQVKGPSAQRQTGDYGPRPEWRVVRTEKWGSAAVKQTGYALDEIKFFKEMAKQAGLI